MTPANRSKFFWLSFFLYWLCLLVYAVFTYSLTAPNLVLSQNRQFWQFQTYMWQTFFNNRELLTQTYALIITTTFLAYLNFVAQLNKIKFSLSLSLIVLLSLIFPLILSNNALSYDVFNYIFNAKMVSVYKVDPHIQVALNFPDDPWLKFMHNIHTPAPYGYGWTFLSLIPYALGFGKFILTWLSFRIFNLIPLFCLAIIYWRNYKHEKPLWANLIIFNPLLLIEVISNSHNDLWMMMPAIWTLLFFANNRVRKWFYLKAAISLAILLLSAWIKLASIALVPIWFLLLIRPQIKTIPRINSIIGNWPYIASLIMFLPLLSSRSQQFHPWYLLWPLTFLPLMRLNRPIKIWANSLLILSISSMYRYLPFLWHNHYQQNVLFWQKVITFAPFIFALIYFSYLTFRKNLPTLAKAKTKKRQR